MFTIFESVAQILACTLISSQLDYCNSLLYGAPEATIKDKTIKLTQFWPQAVRCKIPSSPTSLASSMPMETAMFTHRVMTGVPSCLKQLVVPCVATHQTSSTTSNHPKILLDVHSRTCCTCHWKQFTCRRFTVLL